MCVSAQDQKAEISILHTPAGVVLELNRDITIPANWNSVNLYFIDETICVAELMTKVKSEEAIILPKGYKLRVFRTETVRLKDYYGYSTSAYLFFEDQLVDNIMFACPDLEMKLKDLDNSEKSNHLFKVDYSKASDQKVNRSQKKLNPKLGTEKPTEKIEK
jgi:hypothetical protein